MGSEGFAYAGGFERRGAAPAPEQAADSLTGRWLAVNTHPHREHIAIENLGRQDFETYCPLIQRQVRHARRTRHVMRPLFPGYVFVRINPDLQRWRPILSTFGVRSLVRCGDRLSFVEDGFVAGLRARELDGIIIKPAEPYQLGQKVRMRSGPFDGLVATIIEMDEKDRLVVLMDLLNQSVKVRVAATDICADARDPG